MGVLDRIADLVARLFVTAPDHPGSGGFTGEDEDGEDDSDEEREEADSDDDEADRDSDAGDDAVSNRS